MSDFTPGSNRERVHNQLTSTPQSLIDIAKSADLPTGAVSSVLDQIRRLGDAERARLPNGLWGYTKGSGKPITAKSQSGSKTNVIKYLSKKIGQDVVVSDAKKALKINDGGYINRIFRMLEQEGKLILINANTRPLTWTVHQSILDASTQTSLIPAKPKQAPQPLPPEVAQPGSLTGALMQLENQNIVYKQTLIQLIPVYEQFGNILEAAGLLED